MYKKTGILSIDLINVAEIILANFIKLPENPKPERTGGYMAVYQSKEIPRMGEENLTYVKWPITVTEIGVCPPDMRRTFGISQEKPDRLHQHLPEGHISSWESRDFDNREYGGGIITPPQSNGYDEGKGKMGSFSGLVEHGDEALVLVEWLYFNWIMWDDAQKFMNISGNDLLVPLIEACKQDLFT